MPVAVADGRRAGGRRAVRSRPTVVIPAGGFALADGAVEGVRTRLIRRLEGAGALALVLPRLAPPTPEALALADGLLLAGGGDVHPRFYGEAPRPGLGPVDPARDTLEIHLAREALARGLPVLGICRGMQVVAVALGGAVVQDLGGMPERLEHRQTAPLEHPWHPVRLVAGSRLAAILGQEEILVNSFHHQAVREPLPEGLVPVGVAPDGVLEAFEGRGGAEAPFLVGVAWHPEALEGDGGASERLFDAFVAAAGAVAARRRSGGGGP